MGNTTCVQGTGSNADPDPTGTKFADVPVDGTFIQPNYCDYTTGGTPNCGTAEFVPAGNSDESCTCRGLCNAGCRRKLCRRVSYQGDPVKCCITSAPTLGHGQTCDPKYRSYSTDNCDGAMNTFCSTGDNLFTNANCVSWFDQRLPAATATLETVCANPANESRRECGCIKARKDTLAKFQSGDKVAVECVNNNCTNGGWKTYQMSQNPCNVVNCDMNVHDITLVTNAPGGTYNASFVQQCSNQLATIQKETKPAEPVAPPTPTPPPKPATATDPNLTRNIMIGVGVVIGIIILILIIYFVYSRMKAKPTVE